MGDERRILLNERVAFGEPGTKEDVDWLVCSLASDVIGGETGCILEVDEEGAPDVVDEVANDVCLEVDGTGSETSTTTNE